MSESAEQPTEAMVKAADKAAWAYDSDESNDPLSSYGRMRAALTAALAVSPLREQRDRYERALENIAGTECIMVPDGCPPDDLCWSCEANAALDGPSYKGEQ